MPAQPSQPAAATSGCASAGSPAGPFDLLAYEAANWRSTYGGTLELAAFNQLFPELSSFALPRIETGPRSAGSSSTVNPYIPPVLLKAIAWIESSWQMGDWSVDYGEVGPPLVSSSCAYGIMQVLSGMENTNNVPTLDQASIGSHYGFNIARGAQILAEKWNYAPAYRPIVGKRNPSRIENWYYAIWSYHGFAYTNHPKNDKYDPKRGVYRCDGTQSYSDFPYQELVLGCVANPPVVGGTRLWDPQPVTLPNLADPAFSRSNWDNCSGSYNCAGMDISTPSPYHSDPTTTSISRGQAIGNPKLKASTGKITLVTIPSVQNTPASLTISNTGTGPLAWRASKSASWLKVSRAQGVALGTDLGKQPSTVSVRANPTGLLPGKYTATLKIESLWASGAPVTVSVILHNYPDGTLLKGSGSQVYVIRGGLKRHIPNRVTFEAQGFLWGNVNVIPDSNLNAIPSGQPLLDALADGNLLKGSGDAGYVMEGGKKRHITSPGVLARCGYGSNAIYVISDSRLDGIPTGSSISAPPCPHLSPPSGYLVQGSGDAVYVMQGDLRRQVPNRTTFEAQGFLWSNVNDVPESSLKAIPSGQSLLDALADGNLLRGSGDAVYVMEGGKKRHITSSGALTSCGYDWDAVSTISDSLLDGIPTGSSISGPPCPRFSPPGGALLQGSGDAIYIMQGDLKRHIPNRTTFEAQGFLLGNVNSIADSSLNAIPSGQSLLDALADGNLLRSSGDAVYVMEGGKKRHVKSPSVMASCGYGGDAVYVISDSRLETIPLGSSLSGPPCPRLTLVNGLLVKGDGDPVYLLRGGLKRHMPNAATLEAYGHRWGDVDRIPGSVLSSISEGDPLLDVLADGNLMRGSGDAVYVMEGGKKRHITSRDTLETCYDWDAVYNITDSRLNSLPTGGSLGGPPCPRLSPLDGALLQGTDDPVYAMLAGSKYHIASPGVFGSCGYLSANINAIPDSSLGSIPNGPILTGPPCP